MSGMHKVETSRIADAVAGQFNDHIDQVGRRKFHVRMISIPVAITASEPMEESAFLIQNVGRYLHLFYKHGLIGKENGGVVLLNQLINHVALENAPLSELFALRQAIFESAKADQRGVTQLGRLGETVETEEWLFVPEGYYTMRHLVGVVFWDAAKKAPPIVRGEGNFDDLQAMAVRTLLTDIVQQGAGEVEVSMLPPAALLDSILAATTAMLDKVVASLADEAKSQVGDLVARVTVGCEQTAPGRNQVRITMNPTGNHTHVAASVTVRLSIMESLHTGMVLEGIRKAIEQRGIVMLESEYFSGPIPEDGAAGPLH